jgi:hypothetical protein
MFFSVLPYLGKILNVAKFYPLIFIHIMAVMYGNPNYGWCKYNVHLTFLVCSIFHALFWFMYNKNSTGRDLELVLQSAFFCPFFHALS